VSEVSYRARYLPSYEHLVADPAAEPGRSDGYYYRWQRHRHGRTIARWEPDVNRFGYSPIDLARADDTPLPPPPANNPHRGSSTSTPR
jgi:hypothetical protein